MQIKTTSRFHLTQSKWLSPISKTTTDADKDVGEKDNFYTVGGDLN
jgi:hypothetical protein